MATAVRERTIGSRPEDRRPPRAIPEGTELTRRAGLPVISWFAVLAGILSAFGAFTILVAGVTAVAAAVGIDQQTMQADWDAISMGGAATLAVIGLASWLFGGYVAGRVARRAGLMHGGLTFLGGALLVALIGGIAALFADNGRVTDELANLGMPTTLDEWAMAGTVAGLAMLVAMIAGSLLGGRFGERWHHTVLVRAYDPGYGPAAERRSRAVSHREDAADLEARARELRREADKIEVDLRYADDREDAEELRDEVRDKRVEAERLEGEANQERMEAAQSAEPEPSAAERG